MQNSWHYLKNKTWQGPLSETELIEMFEAGDISKNTRLVRKDEPRNYKRFYEVFSEYVKETDAETGPAEEEDEEPEKTPENISKAKGKIYRPTPVSEEEDEEAGEEEETSSEPAVGKASPAWLRPVLMGAFALLLAIVSFVAGMLVSGDSNDSPYQAFEVGEYNGSLTDGTQIVPSDFVLRLISADGKQTELTDLQIHDWVTLKEPVTLKAGEPALITFECRDPDGTFAFVAQTLIEGDTIQDKNAEPEKENDSEGNTAKADTNGDKEKDAKQEEEPEETLEPTNSSAETITEPIDEYYYYTEPVYETPATYTAPVYQAPVQEYVEPQVRMVWITPDGCWQDDYPADKAHMSPEQVPYDTAIANNYKTPAEHQALLDAIYAKNPQLAPTN